MADLRIGGMTFSLGNKAEEAMGEAGFALLYTQTKLWLETARRLLPREHPALVEMQRMCIQYEKAKGIYRI
jgi:hypothetical protein